MSRLSCVQNCLCPDYRAFIIAYVQTIVRSKLHMSRLSCVQNCICPDYRAFIFFSRPCNFERTTPPCAFISVWTYRLSVWDLNLGSTHKFRGALAKPEDDHFERPTLKKKSSLQTVSFSKRFVILSLFSECTKTVVNITEKQSGIYIPIISKKCLNNKRSKLRFQLTWSSLHTQLCITLSILLLDFRLYLNPNF